MKIRVVKPVAPIKINNHWVYRIDDTVEIDLDMLSKWMDNNFMDANDITEGKEIVNVVSLFLKEKLGGK